MILNLLLAFLGMGGGQENLIPDQAMPRRIAVHHADPFLIVSLLEGRPQTQPELSAFPGFTGLGGGQNSAPGAGNSLIPPGYRIFVNPTDNSIWLVPDK